MSRQSDLHQRLCQDVCNICKGEGWVCENHPDVQWNDGNPGCCGGAGKPCKCNKAQPPWKHEDQREGLE